MTELKTNNFNLMIPLITLCVRIHTQDFFCKTSSWSAVTHDGLMNVIIFLMLADMQMVGHFLSCVFSSSGFDNFEKLLSGAHWMVGTSPPPQRNKLIIHQSFPGDKIQNT